MFDFSNWAVDSIRWMGRPFIIWPDGTVTENMRAVWWVFIILGIVYCVRAFHLKWEARQRREKQTSERKHVL